MKRHNDIQPHPRSTQEMAPLEGRFESIARERLEQAKFAFATRRVQREDLELLLTAPRTPSAGDLVLARVTRRRQHGRLELPSGRRAQLYDGDEIVVAYGNRYATDQFEGLVPDDLGPCHLLAAGGIAARMTEKHSAIRPATEIEPIGLLGRADGTVVNLADFAIEAPPSPVRRPFTLAVVGSAMNAGKTTTAAYAIRGLRKGGVRTGAAKVTGTGSGGDMWKFFDAGANDVVDFTDAGHASTYKLAPGTLATSAIQLCDHLAHRGARAIVVEVADGIFQRETEALLDNQVFRERIEGFLVAVTDSLSAVAAVDWFERRRLPLLGLCGTINRSPLAVREAVAARGVPVLSLQQLAEPGAAIRLPLQSAEPLPSYSAFDASIEKALG